MTALILSFITGAVSFVWLHLVFIRNGFSKGMSMFLSSTIGGFVSSAVYYVINAVF